MTTVTIREANQNGARMYEITVRGGAGGESTDVATVMLTHEQSGALLSALRVFSYSDLQAVAVTAESRPPR